MYNLLVSASDDAWEGKHYVYQIVRAIREYTSADLKERLSTFDKDAIDELLTLPCIFAYEDMCEQDARFGWLKEIRRRDGEVRVQFKFDREAEPIPWRKLGELAWELDIGSFEMNRSHWAVKDEDLVAVLETAGLIDSSRIHPPPTFSSSDQPDDAPPQQQRLVNPNVFRFPSDGRDLKLVSVMMPFDASFSKVYEAIQSACQETGLYCERADSIWEDSVLVQDIFNLLFRSSIVVVDFSNRNANVMYETGIAHTLGREVVPISQSLDDVPFDLKQHRVLKYLPNNEGLAEMQVKLAKRLETLAARKMKPG